MPVAVMVENEKGSGRGRRVYPRPPKGFGEGLYQEADRGSNGHEALDAVFARAVSVAEATKTTVLTPAGPGRR